MSSRRTRGSDDLRPEGWSGAAGGCDDDRVTRRAALRALGLAAGGAVLGGALGGCAAPPLPGAGGASGVPPGRGPDTPVGNDLSFPGPTGTLHGVWAPPVRGADRANRRPSGAVLVVHDDRGLTDHFYDLVGRFAGAGYGALCVDLRRGRDLAGAPTEVLLTDLRAGLDELRLRFPGRKLGAVGFGFGAGLVWRLLAAGEQRLAAAVPFYGEIPEEPDFSRCRAAVLAIYGQFDEPVNATQDKADYKLFKANRVRSAIVYPGTRHAFFDDTGPGYDAGAAAAAWRDTGGWLDRHL